MSRADEIARLEKRTDEILIEMRDALFPGLGNIIGDSIRPLHPFAEKLARAEAEPQGHDMLDELRVVLGLGKTLRHLDGPVWKETLEDVKQMLLRAANCDTYKHWVEDWQKRALKAESDLAAALPDLGAAQHWKARAWRAEAEVDRLRVALNDLNKRIEQTPQPEGATFPGESIMRAAIVLPNNLVHADMRNAVESFLSSVLSQFVISGRDLRITVEAIRDEI